MSIHYTDRSPVITKRYGLKRGLGFVLFEHKQKKEWKLSPSTHTHTPTHTQAHTLYHNISFHMQPDFPQHYTSITLLAYLYQLELSHKTYTSVDTHTTYKHNHTHTFKISLFVYNCEPSPTQYYNSFTPSLSFPKLMYIPYTSLHSHPPYAIYTYTHTNTHTHTHTRTHYWEG